MKKQVFHISNIISHISLHYYFVMGRTKKHPRDILSKGVRKPSTTPIVHKENSDKRIGRLEIKIGDIENSVDALEKRMEELTKMNEQTLAQQNKMYNTMIKYSVLLSQTPHSKPPHRDDVVLNSQEIHFQNGSIGLDKESLRSSLELLL